MSKRIILVFIILTGCFTSGYCQDSSGRSVNLDEVIVTANKIHQKQTSTGKVVTVITKEQIDKSSGKTIAQLLNEQAGIIINGALNNLGSNQTIYMRGASSGRTLILLDGIPVYDPSNINNEFDINLLSLNNVESIEISRGSQSTLYGSDAIAGVINIITTSNVLSKPFNFKGTLAAGNYGTFRGNGDVYGKINKLSYSFKYAKLYSDGFSAAFDSTAQKHFANNKYNGDVLSSSLKYQLSDELSVNSYLQNSSYKTNLDAGAFIDEKDYTVSNKALISGFGFHFEKGNALVNANFQYAKTKRYYFNDSTDTPTFIKFSTDNYVAETKFAEIYSSIAISKNVTLLEGGDFRFYNFSNQYHSISDYGPYNSTFNDTALSQSSIYSSLLFHCDSNKLNIELGGRLNVHSRYGSNTTYTFNPSYKFSEHFRLFGSIESGFKAPSLYQLYAGGGTGNSNLKPEKSKTEEIGIQSNYRAFTTRLNYFHRDITDGLDFDYNNFTYFNFNRQTVNGIEVEIACKPLKALSLNINYTYLKPTENVQSRLTAKDTTYDYLLRRPENSFNINAGYQVSPKWYISLSGKYTGSRYDVTGYQMPDILLNSYFILGAYTEYKIDHRFKIFTDLQNITNRKFIEVRGYNSIPFLFNAGLSFNL